MHPPETYKRRTCYIPGTCQRTKNKITKKGLWHCTQPTSPGRKAVQAVPPANIPPHPPPPPSTVEVPQHGPLTYQWHAVADASSGDSRAHSKTIALAPEKVSSAVYEQREHRAVCVVEHVSASPCIVNSDANLIRPRSRRHRCGNRQSLCAVRFPLGGLERDKRPLRAARLRKQGQMRRTWYFFALYEKKRPGENVFPHHFDPSFHILWGNWYSTGRRMGNGR